MPGSLTVQNATGGPVLNPAVDVAMCIVGPTGRSPLAAGLVSPPYGSPPTLFTDFGPGDTTDAAMQAVARSPGNPSPPAVSVYATPATNVGTYGTINVSGVLGTVVVTNHTAQVPTGTHRPWMKIRTGGILGSAGMDAWASLDGGVTKQLVQLGAATTYDFPTADGFGGEAGFSFAPSTTNAAYVALAVELRADTLAHLANAVAHDGADTNAGQIALAASSVPATVTASTTVVNLVLTALQLHVVNITTVHEGPDLVAYTALAALSAATDTKTGIDLAIAIKAILNTHEAVALAADDDALMGATASIASPTTYTAADMFSGGIVLMDAQPRRPTVTTGASGTPANMAATAALSGFDYAGNAQSETLTLSQTAGTATAAKAYRGTGFQAIFATADGTAASFTIGIDKGVHESADSTNTISSADPTYGTLLAGDVFYTNTLPPTPASTDIYAAGTPATGALGAIGSSSQGFGLVVFPWPLTEAASTAVFAAAIAGLNNLLTFNKRPTLIFQFRDQLLSGETTAQYVTAARSIMLGQDNRIVLCVGGGLLTDAYSARTYLRSGLPSVLAMIQGSGAKPGAEGEVIAQSPGWAGRGPLEGFSLVDGNGNLVFGAVDAFTVGGLDGPVGAFGGALNFCYQRDDANKGTYVSAAPCMYGVGSTVLTLMDSRVVQAMQRTLYSVSWPLIQGAAIVKSGVLDPDVQTAIAHRLRDALRTEYAHEFANPEDPNLVLVDPNVTVSGPNVSIRVYVADELFDYINGLTITLLNVRS